MSIASARFGAKHATQSPTWTRSLLQDRTRLGLLVVFLIVSLTYAWRATVAVPLALHGAQLIPYNELADALLHFHLWVAHLPAHPLSGEPLDPRLRPAVVARYRDFALNGRYVYLTWGPAPVLVLLVPLHILGFEPSESVIILPFVIAGLGCTLAALRVIIRQVGTIPLWMTMLAGFALAYSSIAFYLVRHATVYFEAVAGGYCFAMAGAWLALSVVAARRASLWRLALMSLCFGLAIASRPTLGVTVVVPVAVYASLRSTRQPRGWVAALVLPIAVCLVLLAGYDQARFGDPLQYGTQYQLNGQYHTAHWGSPGYVIPGLWSYLITPPHPSILFPFLYITNPLLSYPLSLPAHYTATSEETGGLLAMSPIVIFLMALPWIRRRRPALLGPLATPLVAIAGAGVACLLFISYEFFGTTERYAGDYASLLLLGAVAAWLALARAPRSGRRWLIMALGTVLATWSCLTGLAIGGEELQRDPSALTAATDIGSPLSTAIAELVGHPVLAEIVTPNAGGRPETTTNLETNITSFWLTAYDRAEISVVSPDAREVVLAFRTTAGPALTRGVRPAVALREPDGPLVFRPPLNRAETRIQIHLHRGVNHFALAPLTVTPSNVATEPEPLSDVVLKVEELHMLPA
jgi:hypothetical protein